MAEDKPLGYFEAQLMVVHRLDLPPMGFCKHGFDNVLEWEEWRNQEEDKLIAYREAERARRDTEDEEQKKQKEKEFAERKLAAEKEEADETILREALAESLSSCSPASQSVVDVIEVFSSDDELENKSQKRKRRH